MNIEENHKEVSMKNLSWQITVIICAAIVGLSGIAIALVADGDVHCRRGPGFGAFDRMMPPPALREEMGGRMFEKGRRAFGGHRGRRDGAQGYGRGRRELSARDMAPPPVASVPESPGGPLPDDAATPQPQPQR